MGAEDFGFKHIMWVYSGRRGVHCWVADRRARLLSNDGRSAVAEYLSCYVGTGGSNGRQVDLTYPLHPRMRKVYDEVLKDQFEFLLISDQQILNGEDDRQRGIENALLDMIQDPDVQKKVRDRFSRCTSGEEKWHALKDEISKLQANIQRGRGGISTTMRRTANAIEDIVFAHLYPVGTSPSPLPFAPPPFPVCFFAVFCCCAGLCTALTPWAFADVQRLDIAVSRHLNHLLKAPFAIHPKTGRVCTPMDISKVEDFDPTVVPTIGTAQTCCLAHAALPCCRPSLRLCKLRCLRKCRRHRG